MKYEIKEMKTKLSLCPNCGSDTMYGKVAIGFDGMIYFPEKLGCNGLDCGQRFEIRGGWLLPVREK